MSSLKKIHIQEVTGNYGDGGRGRCIFSASTIATCTARFMAKCLVTTQ
jgi:hypothetical protein